MKLPKEKAIELIEIFKLNCYEWNALGNKYPPQQQALICVNEILNSKHLYNKGIQYWAEVKAELNNIIEK